MIVIVSAQDQYMESLKDDRFGRCPWFIKINLEKDQWKAFPNPGVGQSGGAGVTAAQFVIDQNAEAVISGDFGPHAANAFRAAHVPMYLFNKEISTVAQVVELLKQEKLSLFE